MQRTLLTAAVAALWVACAGKEQDQGALRDVIAMLRDSSNSNPQIEMIIKAMKKWAKDNGVPA